ncbi:MAG: hypothetical protein A2Y38_05520 [Spirochaetes bacterium GWB1_59_5]|nr:MAG: hypothetical protein A2Y38_05520 [Spirochaetes bacterium GWB1_59_5]
MKRGPMGRPMERVIMHSRACGRTWDIPYTVKLRIDQDFWPLQYRPSAMLFSAIGNDVFRRDAETFMRWSVRKWPGLGLEKRMKMMEQKP